MTPTSVPAVVVRDLDDDQVIAAAVAAGTDLVVSAGNDLLDLGSYGNIPILNAADALQHLDAGA